MPPRHDPRGRVILERPNGARAWHYYSDDTVPLDVVLDRLDPVLTADTELTIEDPWQPTEGPGSGDDRYAPKPATEQAR